MVKRKHALRPVVAAIVASVTIIGVFGVCSLVGARAQGPAWSITILFLLFSAIALGSAGSYEKPTAIAHVFIGTIALMWGVFFLVVSVFAATMPGLSAMQMWMTSTAVLVLIASANEVRITLGEVKHLPTPVLPGSGFVNVFFSTKGRQWFIGCCLLILTSLVIISITS